MRMTKLGAAAMAASISFGGAALAFADDVMPADPTVEGETTTTTALEEATTTTVAGDTEPTTTTTVTDEEGGDEAGEAKAHPDNHGKVVSETARNTPPGPGHGKVVSEVARSTNHGHTKGDKPKKPKAPDTSTE